MKLKTDAEEQNTDALGSESARKIAGLLWKSFWERGKGSGGSGEPRTRGSAGWKQGKPRDGSRSTGVSLKQPESEAGGGRRSHRMALVAETAVGGASLEDSVVVAGRW
ncbi:hypothetical protein KSP40_PGU006694 [Platanthera guangdongensis]|uniref:Uncharacterized protein n=1 Tax=Platanthera guangdongensis TaxID=2320717 RepID=A0ABR2MXP0_9ASPA